MEVDSRVKPENDTLVGSEDNTLVEPEDDTLFESENDAFSVVSTRSTTVLSLFEMVDGVLGAKPLGEWGVGATKCDAGERLFPSKLEKK